jgi:hypothetical protein
VCRWGVSLHVDSAMRYARHRLRSSCSSSARSLPLVLSMSEFS